MPGITVAAKVWRWTPFERVNSQLGAEDYLQIGGIAPSYRGVRLNPYENGTPTARDGRVLKGQQNPSFTPPSRHTTNTGGVDSDEGAFKMIDTTVDQITNSTKWDQQWLVYSQTGTNRRFLEWEWPRLVKADGMWLSTANDCATYPGRRPISWNLDAFLPGKGWYRVFSARNVTPAATNVTWYGPFEFKRLIPVSGVKGP